MMLETTGLFAALAVLALIDATSISTLVISLWLVLRAKNPGDLCLAMAYLAVIAAFYLAVGLLLLGGVELVSVDTSALMGSSASRWAVLLLGAGMMRVPSRRSR